MQTENKKVNLEVPYFSQFNDIGKEEYRNRGCTITCLKMALEYLKTEDNIPSIDELFEESEIIQQDMLKNGVITEKVSSQGRVHDVVVLVAHNHGLPAYKEEFRSVKVDLENKTFVENGNAGFMLDYGLRKIKKTIENGSPVIVSVLPGLSEGKSYHTIILIGVEIEDKNIKGFYYHDSDSRDGGKANQYLGLSDFLKFWRRMAIFIN